MTLIQACEEAGVEIPRFLLPRKRLFDCRRNCRMCLVEVVGALLQPAAFLRHAGARFAAWARKASRRSFKTNFAHGEKGRDGRDGIPADQTPRWIAASADQGGECEPCRDQGDGRYGVELLAATRA